MVFPCPGPERRPAAILSAEIAGYSRLMAEDEDATIQMVNARRRQVPPPLEQHRGRKNSALRHGSSSQHAR